MQSALGNAIAVAHNGGGAFQSGAGQRTLHELGIAYNLVEIASESAREAGAARVTAVHLRLGALAGVVRGALEFCYEIATAGTLLDGSRLHVQELPVRVYCAACAMEAELETVQSFRCPRCGAPSGEIRQGRELELASIEIEMPEEAGAVPRETADPSLRSG